MKEEEGERKTRADLPFPSPTNTAANNKILKRTYWEDMPIRHCGGGEADGVHTKNSPVPLWGQKKAIRPKRSMVPEGTYTAGRR